MRVWVISPVRWTAQGVAGALERAGPPQALRVHTFTPDELAAVTDDPPDVVLIVGADAAAAPAMLDRLPPALPLLWLGDAEPAKLPAFLTADGAGSRQFAWLPADTDDARLLAAVGALGVGLSVYDASLGRAGRVEADSHELREPLTPRELEVFELMAKGLGNRDIARALGISSHTAKFHVAQILEKTGSATRTEAVRQGLRLGLIGL
jgi:DNA-binding NarL/FixJ family response regulator